MSCVSGEARRPEKIACKQYNEQLNIISFYYANGNKINKYII